MRNSIFIFIGSIFFVFGCYGQNDTITGILKYENGKPVKNLILKMSSGKPSKIKTDSRGLFRIPSGNLQDTLLISIKKLKTTYFIPINGYKFMDIQLLPDSFTIVYQQIASKEMLELIATVRDKTSSSNVITRERVEKSGCTDVFCLLRLVGAQVNPATGEVLLRGGPNSMSSSSSPLVVINDVAYDNISILRSTSINDIGELRVIKEANQYGVRGANGVIVIKTR